jgi:hypothetical protein
MSWSHNRRPDFQEGIYYMELVMSGYSHDTEDVRKLSVIIITNNCLTDIL